VHDTIWTTDVNTCNSKWRCTHCFNQAYHTTGTHPTGTHATNTHATGTHTTGTHPTGTPRYTHYRVDGRLTNVFNTKIGSIRDKVLGGDLVPQVKDCQ